MTQRLTIRYGVLSAAEFELIVEWYFDLSTGNPAKPVLRALLEQAYGVNRVEFHRYNARLFGLTRIGSAVRCAHDLADLLVDDRELPERLGEPYEVWIENYLIPRRANRP